jgi:hypothetical protein
MTHSSSDSHRGTQPSAWSFDLIGHLASLEPDSLPHCSRFQSIATARNHLVGRSRLEAETFTQNAGKI